MAAEPPVREFAPAKINLYLHVTGKRDDGYHLIDSLVVFADAGDRIEAVPAATISLEQNGPFASALPDPASNLVMKAATGLADLFAITTGAHLTLTKHLPIASGIGGGSADAAAALRALIRLWQIDPDDPKLMAFALSLGADVPVCLLNRPAVMRGIGEDLRLVETFPNLPIVLINPGIAVSTPAVFKARAAEFTAPVTWPMDATDAGKVLAALTDTKNDLTPAAIDLMTVIGDVLVVLEELPGSLIARMSGSGATCFAVFGSEAEADIAAQQIAEAHPGWWVQPAVIYGV